MAWAASLSVFIRHFGFPLFHCLKHSDKERDPMREADLTADCVLVSFRTGCGPTWPNVSTV